MPAVAHLYAHNGPPTGGVTSSRDLDPPSGSEATSNPSNAASAAAVGTLGHRRPGSITEVDETADTDGDDDAGDDGEGGGGGGGGGAEGSVARAVEAAGQADLGKEAEAAAGKLLAGAAKERESVMSMSTVVLQEAKRNKRFTFFSEER